MRKTALAVLSSMSLSTSAFAATDLVVDTTKANLFYGASSTSLQTAGFLVSSGTDVYTLNHRNATNQELDKSWQWTGTSFPTQTVSVGSLSYQSQYPGIQEGTISPPQCVAFVKAMTNTGGTKTSSGLPGTSLGAQNLTSSQLANKAIATFFGSGGSYYGHTAILLSPEISGGKLISAWVVDQNWQLGFGRIQKRKMYASGTGVNNLANYSVIQK